MTTYYVDGAVGNDGNDGLAEGAGNAWATVDKAMTVIAAGEICYVKGGSTYTETPVVVTAGTSGAPIIFEGYTETPGDNGKCTIGGTTNCLTAGVLNSLYYIFRNIIFSGASADGVNGTFDNCHWFNCEFNNNGGDGIDADNTHVFVNCVARNNTAKGFNLDATITFIGCAAYANGSEQFYCDQATLVYKNVAYGVTGTSSLFRLGIITGGAVGNTMDGENASGDGFNVISDTVPKIIDNIIYDVGSFAVEASGSHNIAGAVQMYNLLNSNTNDYWQAGATSGHGDVTSAPAFEDEDGDNYIPSDASPVRGKGLIPGGIT